MDGTHAQVSMDESELLKERLQAITDKRRVQEDIAKKRRSIEEEKLQLQYIKKKALREQWLMDGLSPQTGEEQEAQRIAAQEEQEQTVLLQSNIQRIEKEIEDLEAQELNISANEEVILKRLKEVERTAEDIIKELHAGFNEDHTAVSDLICPTPLTVSDPLLNISPSPRTRPLQTEADHGEPKRTTFAMEISVEHDPRTGESHVVAMSTIKPEAALEKGVKVYDDGRKSVYALHNATRRSEPEGLEEMTQSEVEELLSQAMDKEVPSDVQYHQPVYATSYHSSSRPSTPRTPSKTQRLTPTPTSHTPLCFPTQNGAQSPRITEGGLDRDHMGQRSPCSPARSPTPRGGAQWAEGYAQRTPFHIPDPDQAGQCPDPLGQPPNLPNDHTETALVSVTARSEEAPVLIQPVYRSDDRSGPSTHGLTSGLCNLYPERDYGAPNRGSPYYQESEASLEDISALTEDLEEEPVTMIFMGFKNAEDQKDEEDFQAELVMIGNSDEDEDHGDNRPKTEEDGGCLSYHPEGCCSKVFCPTTGVANVSGAVASEGDVCTNCDDLLPLKPTFIHKPGKNSCLDRQPQPTSNWKR